MTPCSYDVLIVGGGLGGAALGRALASAGVRTLIVERETTFRDRVRGEGIFPWGVVEARTLGIERLLLDDGAHAVPFWKRYAGADPDDCRDFAATTPARTVCLDFYHPAMQRTLLDAAQASGAIVLRGAEVVSIEPGEMPGKAPVAEIQTAAGKQRVKVRLVVGADGRRSMVRRTAGFSLNQDAGRLMVAGVLYEGLDAPEDAIHHFQRPALGQTALIYPIGGQRFRTYFVSWIGQRTHPISGNAHIGELVDACVETGVPRDWFEHARAIGPLAAYPGADSWVDHPCDAGVVLIGDAAGASDPSWGSGLALTLRDVRVLRDRLLANDDWEAAAHAYAFEHDRYYGALHRVHDWLTQLLYERGKIADERRARILPCFAMEPDRVPDLRGLGPEAPSDEAARRRFFVEDGFLPAG
ncbi:FAD-dependent oxidoreductase [Paraburkholderia unamae]|uniref:2-polyprenyl-6-methoxyphenol hydroxylase-like FAD-dependent oxidoreductase n=1 Tax=Paraburkholderia unamae TaxID=219649 RepID=A0ABX5KJ45_9BURK|nr:FAD-dependent monooxygenase [Paraburkholderia unamae]PVX75145.1 2-polyprenyl-6-methoxyphenol hydroxylase-like FAD-dependent oxidoreductase [Paraburkholderia unamae]